MPLPTPDKSWIFKTNILLPSLVDNALDTPRVLLALKQALTKATGWTDSTGASVTNTYPWTIASSSNGIVANTADNWIPQVIGTDTNASVTTTSNFTLRIRTGFKSNYFVINVTAGAGTLKTQIVTDLNNNSTFTGLGLVASITGTNQLTISDNGTLYGGYNSYVDVDTAANGSTLNNSCGLPSGNVISNRMLSSTNFSWIVLQQSQINPNYQVCLSFSNRGYPYEMSTFWSPYAGFQTTGLTINSFPTASDRIQFYNNTSPSGLASYDFVLHVAMSTDGQCTRVFGFYNGQLKLFWLWDKPKNPVSGWTNPAICLMDYNSSNPAGLDRLYSSALVNAVIKNTNAAMYVTCESYAGSALGSAQQYTNGISGDYILSPCGLACSTPSLYGRHGEIFDLWWTSEALYAGTCFPSSGIRQFACMSHIVHYWNRSAVSLAP